MIRPPSAMVAATPLCPEHGATMQLRRGRAGEFWGCARFPACRVTAPLGLPGIVCPTCSSPIMERIAKKSGKPFWPCGNRACDFVAWKKPHRCAHGAACFGEASPTEAAPLDPAIPERQSDDVPF